MSKSNSQEMIWKRISIENRQPKSPRSPKKVSSLPANISTGLGEGAEPGKELGNNEDEMIREFERQGILIEVEDSASVAGNGSNQGLEMGENYKNGKLDQAYYQQISNENQSYSIVEKLNFEDSNKNSLHKNFSNNSNSNSKSRGKKSPRLALSQKSMAKLKQILPYLTQFRQQICHIRDEITLQRQQIHSYQHQAGVALNTTLKKFQQKFESKISIEEHLNQKQKQKIDLLENIIKIKEQRIAILNEELEKTRNQNLDLTEKIFDLNQKVAQSELEIQRKIAEIMANAGVRRIETEPIVPQLSGEVFEISAIGEKERHEDRNIHEVIETNLEELQRFKRQFREQQELLSDQTFHPHGVDSLPSMLKHKRSPQKYNISIENTYANMIHEQTLPHHPNPYSVIPAPKPMTPTQKPSFSFNELVRIKSHPYPNLNISNTNNNSSSYHRHNDSGSFNYGRHAVPMAVGSPKGSFKNVVVSRGFDRNGNDFIGKLLNREDERSAGKYGKISTNPNINSQTSHPSTRLNRGTPIPTSRYPKNQEKLVDLGQRIDELRNEIKRQIKANK